MYQGPVALRIPLIWIDLYHLRKLESRTSSSGFTFRIGMQAAPSMATSRFLVI